MTEINLLKNYPKSKRPIEDRFNFVDEKTRAISRKFEYDYFDGDRNFGYGGYYYNKKFWNETVKDFYDFYNMHDNFSILDIGCGKGFMMYDFLQYNGKLNVKGLEISEYAIQNSKSEVKNLIHQGNATKLPFENDSFDLIISINTLHNLSRNDFKIAIKEINRVSKRNSFITVDAWTDEESKDRMIKWNLTALTYMHVDDWKVFFKENNYKGDYYWFMP